MSAANRTGLWLLIAAWFTAIGCGTGAPSQLETTKSVAPRMIEVPADIRPIMTEAAALKAEADAESIRVEYQQPQLPTDARRTYNVQLAAPLQASSGEPIREPTSPPLTSNDTPATPPKRSEFVPIAMPQAAVAPTAPSVPELPAAPTFVASAPGTDGPQLSPPRGGLFQAAESSQSVAHQWTPPEAAQPAPERQVSAPVNSSAETRNYHFASASTTHQAPPTSYQGPVATYQSPAGQNQPLVTSSAIQPIAERALQMADHASTTAQRGMFYSARTELMQALQLLAQALDVQEGSAHHAAALAAGLTALEEARDFSTGSNRPSDCANISVIAANHRTQLLRHVGATPISPVIAQQQYFGYAQGQFVLAAGGVPAASQILYRLGRLQTAMSVHDADALALHAPQSIVFHQAALATDAGNWLAANELGVLYARYGQLHEARQLLVYSVSVHPHVEGWHNLAVVHRRLGETDLAQRAESERQMLAQKATKSADGAGDMVRWVDQKTFAASGSRDVQAPAEQRYAAAPAAAPAASTRR